MKIIDARTLGGKRYLNEDDIHNATITIRQGGVTAGSFTLNQSNNVSIDLSAGGESESGSGVYKQNFSFTAEDSAGVVSWDGRFATFSHSLGGEPDIMVFDNANERVLLDVRYPDSTHFTLDFEDRNAVEGIWTAVAVGLGNNSSSTTE